MVETIKSLPTSICQQEAINLLSKVSTFLPGLIFQILQRQDGSQSLLYISSGCRELYELEPEVLQADFHVLYTLIHPQDVAVFVESIAVTVTTLMPWYWEGRIVTPSGKLKWIQGNATLEPQANGDLIWDGLLMDITAKKQAELQYQAILNAIPDMMFRISRDGKYLDLKSDDANVVLSKEEIVGKNLRDLLPTDVAVISQAAITKTLDSGNLQTCEYQLNTPLGLRDYEARLVASGQDEVLAIVRDITEQKQAEVKLQSLAQKFSKAFSCSPDPITISTLKEGRYIEVNDSFVRLSGYERDVVIGKTALELNIWVNANDRYKLLQELQQNGVVSNWEFEFRRRSGEVIVTLLSAEVIDLEGVPCILVVNHDITERKQTEAQLKLSAQRDRLLAETLARIRASLNLEAILQTTVTEVRQFLQVDRVFIGLNDACCGVRAIAESVDPQYPSLLGLSTNDPAYVQEFKALFKNVKVRIVEDTSKVTASAKLKAHYQEFQTQASLAVPIILGEEVFGVLIANQCSGTRHWQPMEIDLLQQISEQLAIAIQQSLIYQELATLNANLERQVEERTAQLQQKMQELEELNRVKDVVLHTVAHDLRTAVMGNLMVYKHLLNNRELGTTSIPVSCSILERMIQGNERQLGMIDSLLEIHSSEKQGIVLNRELVNFGKMIKVIIQHLQPILNQNQATLINLIPEDLPLVMADASRIQKVLTNLLNHSLQHNPPGLHFTLKAKVQLGMIRMQIQNNGAVMSKVECDRLFDLYVRDPQAPCSTGISLKMYLCRQIIQAHGGEIGVVSHRQHGLNFWFTLPLATPC